MVEKILQTRILNKVDTLENWNKSELKIKNGEICIATVAASAGNGLTEPVVMMKVGTSEEKTFAELPWSFYAKASDVLEAAKDATKLTAFINNVIADADIASNEAMEELAGRVTTVEGDITTLKGDATTDGSIAKAIKDAIDALKLSEELNKKVDKVEGKGLSTNDYTDAEKTKLSNLPEVDDSEGKKVMNAEIIKAEALSIGTGENSVVSINPNGITLNGEDLENRLLDYDSENNVAKANDYNALEAKSFQVYNNGVSMSPNGFYVKDDFSTIYTSSGETLQDELDDMKVEASTTNGNIKVGGEEVTVYTHPESHTASEISDFATEVAKVKVENATQADQATKDGSGNVIVDTYATKGELNNVDAKFANKADKSVVDAMYTNGQIDTAVQGAKDYAKGLVDAIPAQTDYTVTITETTDGLDSDIAKKYTFTQNGAEIGTINLAKELVVTSGSVKEVTEEGQPYADAVVGDKYIELVIANQDTPIYVPAKDLVDIYTATENATEVQVAISNENKISATLVNGGITEEKLDDEVKTKLNKTWEEVGVAKGLVDALADGQVKTNKEAIEAINNTETGILKKAKDYSDGLNTAMNTRVEALEAIDHTHANAEELDKVATGDVAKWNKVVTDFETYNTTHASDYTNAQIDAAIKVNTDAIAKLNDTYATDAEVEAAIASEVERANGAYATTAQGAKADTAIQTVNAVEGSGIKATTNGTDVTIDWDNEVVLVFDCGNAGGWL